MADGEVTEREWGRTVTEAAKVCGWAVYHTWLSVRSEPGWPDLVLVRPPRLVVAELKREKGKLTERQGYWLDLLRACPGIEAYVWRPSDWDEVQRVLRREPPRAPAGVAPELAAACRAALKR